jgi:hypothetical protein
MAQSEGNAERNRCAKVFGACAEVALLIHPVAVHAQASVVDALIARRSAKSAQNSPLEVNRKT